MSDMDKLRAAGLAPSVGEILEQGEAPSPTARFVLASAGDHPPFPGAGIHFNMPDDEYHAIPALSASGVKALAASPMLFWAKTRWLNVDKTEVEDREHQMLGKAYHCRILEGAEAFADRFCVGLDKADYPDVLESTDDIKAAILQAGERPHTKVLTGETAPDPKRPGEVIELKRSAVKDDWIAQLLEIDPDAQVWSALIQAHARDNDGKVFVSAEQMKRVEIAAAMIERDPELSKMVSGGWPEVSMFWECARTGVPMKARVDYLKLKMMVDLKTVANQQEMSIERAIAREIAVRKYNIQPSVYFEGATTLRQLVREQGASVIHGTPEQVAWAMKWARHREPDLWAWIFQQKGEAPITRGLFYPRAGTINAITGEIVMQAKRKFREFSERYGTLPWLDLAPVYDLADEDVPPFVTDI